MRVRSYFKIKPSLLIQPISHHCTSFLNAWRFLSLSKKARNVHYSKDSGIVFFLRLDQSFSLESQGDSLRDTYERHKLADSMKMPGYIGYGDKKSRESFSGAGILNSHPWPLIEGTTTTCSMNR